VGTEADIPPSFHRRANPETQTIRIAVKQNISGEIWGRGAFGGGLPAALAYFGGIAGRQEGTEFTTTVPYYKNGHPEWAYWYPPAHGGDQRVRHQIIGGESFACVEIKPILNRYRCR
jgi:hypothetical protein